jgi:hypothetical protein
MLPWGDEHSTFKYLGLVSVDKLVISSGICRKRYATVCAGDIAAEIASFPRLVIGHGAASNSDKNYKDCKHRTE